ncbi:MAG: TRC40/GET3/ArsA family transport-energizing ATPase [Chloroflexi bacterium]|nr:TRC40/GET3/ArsA family transport-energizing ATPase [Chloroflexota bacterium]
MRAILYTGKGGVGKTTLAAATALGAAGAGQRTLVISTDIAHSLADALGQPLDNEPRQVGGERLLACELDTGEELERYWGAIKRRIAAALQERGVQAPVAGELAVLPGLDEILALVRIKRYLESDEYDVLVIDSAPTGAAMRLLGAPDLQRWYTQNLLGLGKGLSRMLLPALRNVVNLPITEAAIQSQLQALFDQVGALRALLTDAEVTSVRLVLNPDHMSLQETQRAHTYMSLFGLSVDAVLVNRVLPAAVTDPYFGQWKADQSRYLGLIRQTFEPLPVIEVPLRRQEVVGVPALRELAAELFGETNPASRLSDVQTLRFFVEGERQLLALRVSGVPAGEVGLEKQGSLLRVRLGQLRRSIVLPDYLAGLQPAWARLADGELQVAFEEPERTNR